VAMRGHWVHFHTQAIGCADNGLTSAHIGRDGASPHRANQHQTNRRPFPLRSGLGSGLL
jgi:hypothetical protein